MPTILTPEELRARFAGLKRSIAWFEAVSLYHQLRVHADGDMPIWLIKNARPNESEAVQKYRQTIYEPETQNPLERVIGVLEKIRRSPDWMIRFSTEVPPIIPEEETLQKYITGNYPIYDSLENWLFEEALKNLAIDANAVCVVMPKDLNITVNAFVRPTATIYNAHKVLEFVADDYAIVKSDEYSSLLSPDAQQQRQAAIYAAVKDYNFTEIAMMDPAYNKYALPYPVVSQVYYVITTQYYQKWEETPDKKYQLTQQYVHNLNALPAFQLPGKFYKRMGNNIVKKTPLFPMVPHLNKAARESNDLDAGVIMHLFPERWRIDNSECKTCKGTTVVPNTNGGAAVTCGTCGGTGRGTRPGPMSDIVVSPGALGQSNVPVPPVGYVVKDSSIIELQNTRIEQHIYKALSAVNMEHLSDTQLNQSGTAKAFDGDEVNNMIYLFAGMLVYVAETTIYWINELRYQNLVADTEKREACLPVVPVPEKFDVVNTTFLIQEYQNAKNAGLNSIILREMQKDLSQKKFYANPDVAKFVQTIMELDPFPDKTIEEKSLLEAQQLATKEDVILSNYIVDFVNQAKEEKPDFLDKTRTEKRDILLVYAKKKNDLLNTAKQLQQDMFQPTPDQQAAQQQMTQFNQDTRLMNSVQNAKV